MKTRNPALPLSRNKHLLRWVEKMAELTKPAAIHWVDGSEKRTKRSVPRWSRAARSSS